MNSVKKYLFLGGVILFIVSAVLLFSRQESPLDQAAAKIPIQHNGRVKSFDAFARETLRLVSGKENWDKKSAVSFIFSHLSTPSDFLTTPMIRLDHIELKTILNLSQEKKYFSHEELQPALSYIITLIQNAQDKRGNDLRPTAVEQAAETLYNRLITVDRLASKELLRVVPSSNGVWQSGDQASGLFLENFEILTLLYAKKSPDFVSLSKQWNEEISRLSTESFEKEISAENFYYKVKPFLWAWVLYSISFVLLLLFGGKQTGKLLAEAIIYAGFLFHSGGLLLRMLILHRPPVSNMYESIVFMNWILMAGAFIFFMAKKQYFILAVGAAASTLVMLFADLLPVEKSLDVLAPVLKSHYWLTMHVLTIVSSYGIFGLAMALGHRHLFLDVLKKFSEDARGASAQVINRLLQAGLIALGIGTVLGGVWANESWGRFWGWDPKETWALITFLGYMVVLHFRHAGKLNDFNLAVSAVVGFLLVLMTWYGVNFILGRGLHSYGFGAGGKTWIIYYLIFEAVFLAFVFLSKSKIMLNRGK